MVCVGPGAAAFCWECCVRLGSWQMQSSWGSVQQGEVRPVVTAGGTALQRCFELGGCHGGRMAAGSCAGGAVCTQQSSAAGVDPAGSLLLPACLAEPRCCMATVAAAARPRRQRQEPIPCSSPPLLGHLVPWGLETLPSVSACLGAPARDPRLHRDKNSRAGLRPGVVPLQPL